MIRGERVVTLRAVAPSDRGAVAEAAPEPSPRTLYLRFFSQSPRFTEEDFHEAVDPASESNAGLVVALEL